MGMTARASGVLCLALALFVVGGGMCHAVASTPKEVQRILFLSSYHASFPTAHEQLDSILAHVPRSEGNKRRIIDVEYLDSKRFPEEPNQRGFFDRLRDKMASLDPYDVIISADDNALRFLERSKEELFGSTPVVFFGVNNHELGERMALRPDYAGLLEAPQMDENAALPFALIPKLETLHVIVDATNSGQSDWAAFERSVPAELRARCELHQMSELSFDEMAERLRTLGPKDAVFLIACYVDKEGRRREFDEVVEWLNAQTSRPVFHPYRHGVGDGLVGGKVVSHYEMAEVAGAYATRILHGMAPSALPLVRESGSIYYFDYVALSRAGIALDLLPAGSTVLGEPSSLLYRHRGMVLGGVATVGALLLVSLGLGLLYLRQRRLFKELNESEECLRSVFESSPSPMLLIDQSSGQIVSGNRAAMDFYGYSLLELRSKRITDIVALPSNVVGDIKGKIAFESQSQFQSRHRLANGDLRQVQVAASKVLRAGRPTIFCIINDVTERKQREAELIEARLRAEAASRAKDSFLSVMSHELRTPINPILGFASLLESTLRDPDELYQLQSIQEAGMKLLSIVDSLLAYASIRSGELGELCREELRPLAFLESVVAEYQEKSGGARLRFRNGIAGYFQLDYGLTVSTDRVMLRRILDNLIENALKFAPNGNIELRCGISLAEQGDKVELRVELEDDGIGIAPEMLGKIFEPFVQANNSFTREFEGVGLGLTIASEAARALGGQLNVESAHGEGALFWFSLPLFRMEFSSSKFPKEKAAG